MSALKQYRIFYVDETGRIGFEDLHAKSDAEAVSRARHRQLAVRCEVWDRQKLIAKIPKYEEG